MNENQLTIVKDFDFKKPLLHKIDSIIDKCIKDCHKNYFHSFEYKCAYDIKLTNIRKQDINNLTIADESMGLHDLNKN